MRSSKSINRNILECKEVFRRLLFYPAACINRNILECKGNIVNKTIHTISVLIETYWNVKDYSKSTGSTEDKY